MEHVLHVEIQLPVIGLGTWDLRGDACVAAVRSAIELGYRHIDTARHYANEAEVGIGLRRSGVPRDEVFVTTKLLPGHERRASVRPCVEASLQDLGLDHVDLLLIHWPNPDVPVEETVSAMADLQRAGLVRFLGVSNFGPSLLRSARTVAPLFTNQIEYHPYLAQAKVIAETRGTGAIVTAYRPLMKGRVGNDPVLRDLAAAHDVTPEQVTLRWLIQQSGVVAIPKATSAAHQRANLEVFGFELDDEEMAAIFALNQGLRLTRGDGVVWEA